jgi:hypothetical protein
VRTERIVFSVLLLGNAVAIVGILVTQGWQHAISPALMTVLCETVLIRLLKNPPTAKPWTRRRVVLSAAGGVAFVIAVPVWFVRKAQREHREVSPAESD